MVPHLARVFQKDQPVEWEGLNDVRQRTVIEDLDNPISWDDLLSAVSKLANGKSPGLNGVPLGSFKALSGENLKVIHAFFIAYW